MGKKKENFKGHFLEISKNAPIGDILSLKKRIFRWERRWERRKKIKEENFIWSQNN